MKKFAWLLAVCLVLSGAFEVQAFSLRMVADNDFAVFTGNSSGINNLVYQSNGSWGVQIANLQTIDVTMPNGDTEFYVLGMGGGGQENICGTVNGEDMVTLAGGGKVLKSGNLNTYLYNYPVSGGSNNAVENGSYSARLVDVQTAYPQLTWSDAISSKDCSATVIVQAAPPSGCGFNINPNNAVLFKFTATDVNLDAAHSFVGTTTTMNVFKNAAATDITSLLHFSDPESGQTVTWSQSVAPDHGGTLAFSAATADSGSTDITPGGTITYTPASGYVGTEHFTVQASDGFYRNTRLITVTVQPHQYTVTPTGSSHGSITPVSPVTVSEDLDTTFTIIPEAGYKVAIPVGGTCSGTYTGDIRDSVNGIDYTTNAITADCSVEPTFLSRPQYTVASSAGSHGSITPTGDQTAYEDDRVTFTIKPDDGYMVVTPVGGTCGGSFTGNISDGVNGITYTTSAVNSDCSVAVAFTPGSQAPRYNVTIGSGTSSGGAWSGGVPDVWMPTTSGATVAASEIQSRLANGAVIISTNTGSGSENGDIIITAPISWDSNSLTLDAARDVHINNVLSASGSSVLDMNTALVTTGGMVKTGFAPAGGFAGRVDFFLADGSTPRSGIGFLTINGSGYTVITALGDEGSTSGTDLQGINGAMDGRYALGANVDATATGSWTGTFLPLGNSYSTFTGAFNGLGHTVSSLVIDGSNNDYAGLFGYAYNAAISNLGVTEVNIGTYSSMPTGALAGALNASSITNSFATGSVSGSYSTGGLVGNLDNSVISGSYAAAMVSGSDYTGGLAGYSGYDSSISNCYASGTVTGYYYIGGLVGYLDSSDIGITGSYATGAVTGSEYIGGLVGQMAYNASIYDSYTTGSVSGDYFIGGLVGLLDYSDRIGITNSYAAGAVSGVFYIGGLVGYNGGYFCASASFWDSAVNNSLPGVGEGDSSGVTGVTTSELKNLATFSGWDIAGYGGSGKTWRMYDGQTNPLLRSFLAPLAISANDAAVQSGTPYSGGNGVSYSPAGYTAGLVTGTITYGGDSQGASTPGSYSIVPGGLYSNQTGYDITFVNGTLTILLPSVNIYLTINGNGSVHGISTPHGQVFSCDGGTCPATAISIGDEIVLSATAGSHSTLSGWEGACTASSGDCTLQMSGDKTLVATFSANPTLVKIAGDQTIYYSIHAALAAASAPVLPDLVTEIRARSMPDFDENVFMTNPASILLRGGYGDADFTNQDAYTTIHGVLLISGGKLVAERVNVRAVTQSQ